MRYFFDPRAFWTLGAAEMKAFWAGGADVAHAPDEPLYRAELWSFARRQMVALRGPSGEKVATIRRRALASRPAYDIIVGGRPVARVRKRAGGTLLAPPRERFTVGTPSGEAEVAGDIPGERYTIARDGRTLASVRPAGPRRPYAPHACIITIAEGADDVLMLACVLAVELGEHVFPLGLGGLLVHPLI